MSTYIDPILTMLQENYPQPNALTPHPLWNYSADNQLPANWLLATPTNVWGLTYSQFKQAVPAATGPLGLATCTVANGPTQLCQPMDASMTAPGQTPQKLLVGHSDAIVDALYDVMISANVLLDVTTLSPPTGRFLDSMQNALKYLSNKPAGQRPIVRVLIANSVPTTVGPLITSLTSGLDASKGLRVYCFVMSSSFLSWNHAKIVAADGVQAIAGGHNMWEPHYLGVNPVHDVSMRLTGTAARHAQDFANSMWVYGQWYKDSLPKLVQDYSPYITLYMSAYGPTSAGGASSIQSGVLPPTTMYSTATSSFPAPPAGGSIPVLSVGRGGDTKSAYLLPKPDSYTGLFNEPADEAIVKLISLAQRTIRMSIQAFHFYVPLALGGGWNPALLNAMADALNRGVTISAVISNPGATAGGLSNLTAGYNTDPPNTVNAELASTLVDRFGLTQAAAEQLVSAQLSVATFRYSADPTYPVDVPIGNHAKTVIVDDTAYYIGSQNLYACNLNEFGFIVEDAASAQTYVTDYWAPLWQWSAGTAAVTPLFDPDVQTDHQVDAMQFILALPLDTMLNAEWTKLLNQYNAATDPTAKAAVQQQMNELITSAGFDTTALTVLAGLQLPFFSQTPPSTDATAEALRFVANLMNSPSLMIAFNKIVMTPGSVAATTDAVNAFLTSNGYSCTMLQVLAAFAQLQTKTQAYWSGTYTTWLTDDGGITYANASNTSQPNTATAQALQPRATTDDPPLPALGPALVITPSAVTYGGATIVKPVYNNNQLTWSSSDGNATSASIRFGVVTRATLNDIFTGVECFGSVTYPASGNPDYRGTYSLYGRAQTANPATDAGNRAAFTIGLVVGALVLLGLLGALGVAGYRSVQRQNEKLQSGQDKRNEGPDTPESSVEKVRSPRGISEGSTLRQRLLQDYSKTSEGMLTEMAPYEVGMNTNDRISLESSATGLREANTALEDPSAEALPSVVESQGISLGSIGSTIQSIIKSVAGLFSSTTQDSLTASSKVQTDINQSFEKVGQQQEDDEPFTFDDDAF